jgi:hypothetical protein
VTVSPRPNAGQAAGFRLARLLLDGSAIRTREAAMKKTATSIGRRTPSANPRTWTAISGALFAVASLAACGPAGGGMAIDAGTLIDPDSSVMGSGPDAGTSSRQLGCRVEVRGNASAYAPESAVGSR